ncbi:reverse transcriptase domain-containing protein [Tanacetum coccineum]
MRTRSQSRNLNRQQQQAPPALVEPFNLEEPIENPDPPVVTMADNRTMAQLLKAPTEGYEDAIVVPEITADNFELKHGLLTLIIHKQRYSMATNEETNAADTSDKVSMIAILTDLQTQLDGHAKVNQDKCLEIETLNNELLQCKQEICRLDTHKVKLDLENKVRHGTSPIRIAFAKDLDLHAIGNTPTIVLELEVKFLKQSKMVIESEKLHLNAIFEINKLRDQLQGKDTTIRNLMLSISNIMKVLNAGSTELDGLKVENVSLKRRYDELSKANTHSPSEKPKYLLQGCIPKVQSTFHLQKEQWVKNTPLPKKKQVTFQEPPRTSNRPTQKPPVQQNKKPNVPVNLSTRTKPATESRKPMPKSHTRNHHILPNKSVNARRAAYHNRKLNVVDHNQFVIRSLKSVNTKTPQAKHSVNHTKQVWKATRNHNVNTTKTAWRPTRKVVGSVKPQWKPTGRYFALYDNCPLTRIMEPIVEPLELTPSVSSSLSNDLMDDEKEMVVPPGYSYVNALAWFRTAPLVKCMRTRSQSSNLNHQQQQQAQPAFVEPFNLEEPIENPTPLVVTMDDNHTMAQLLEAPTEGYEDAIVIPEITVDNFELKHGLLTLITSTMKFSNVPSTSVKLMLSQFSLERGARIWLEKEPPRSILTWDDIVSKFINKFFPPSKTTNLRNEITRFQQRFDELFYEAWDRFNDLLRAYSLNSAAGGKFLDKMPRECLRIIESKSKVRNSRNKPVVSKVGTNTSTSDISPEVAVLTTNVAKLKDMMKTLILDKQKSQAPATIKAVEEKCVTCGGAHSYRNCPATDGNDYRDNIQE